LGLARDMSRSPLFNVMMAYGDADTAGEDIRFDWTEVRFHEQVEGFDPAVFDLVFFFNEKGKQLDCEIMYNSDLFERGTIERLAANFLTLVKHVPENINKPIFDLDYIEKEEYKTIVHLFNDNEKEFLPLTIQESVEMQVEKSLNRIAVVSPAGWAITYDEMNQRANHLAHYLRKEYNMGPGQVIGICIERSIEMIIAVLGVVKSGAAYLSFDPNYPKDRVKHMIDDSQAGLIISDRSRPDLFESGQTLLDIHTRSGRSLQNPQVQNELTDAVYVIYTSGSTGTPNGAMLSHALLSNLLQWQAAGTGIDGSLRCLQFTSINFCVSFQEIFTTLSSGGEVHLIGDIERQDIEYLMQFLARRKIGNLYLPFSYLNFLFNLSNEATTVTYLQHIITAGEQLKITGGLKKFLEQNPGIKLHNHYGSSEMHVVTSFTLDAQTASRMPVPPAGKPIANTRIYILDENERPVPIGVWGELFVDGSSQVLGYIHNPVLTDKKLVWYPALSQLSGHRLYRSGDVGRWLPDGNIELKGRKDFQVKIRGFRVEPSEIESKILALENVKDCVVVVKENSPAEKILVAYIVSPGLDVSEIKRHLGSYLPQYMIPKFMVLESLPLMPNGKVDREKLPPLPEPPAQRPEPVVTARREQIKDFDQLPIPDRSLVDYDKYGQNIGLAMVRHTVSLQASRGCPYNCLYCHKIWPKKHVFRSAENIFSEVELYYRMGVRRFVLVDDIFNLDVENSSRFFEMVIKKGLKAHFFFPNGLRSDILTKDYIDLMAAGGTKGIGMALESASPRIQRLLKKNLDLEKLQKNAEYLCHKHPEIILELFLMHGFPTETEAEAVMTLDFLKALHWIDFPYLHILKIFPHTDMAAMAMENGVSEAAISRSAGLAFHELPETLPFAKSFTLKCQAEFLGDYFLLKERLLSRLPRQMQVLTPQELVEKYNSYLPVEIKTVNDVLEFAGIEPALLEKPDENEIMSDEKVRAIDLNDKIVKHFVSSEPEKDALRILLLDLSQFFSDGKKILYDGVEPPLGLMYLLTYLKRELGPKVNGKIAKSRVDFDRYDELKALLEEFKPQVLGIRTLTYYGRFFHEVVGYIRQWGFTGPVIAGGPYATSDYATILKDPHVDVVVLSEGELTFTELVNRIIAHQKELPPDETLKEIAGLAFVPGNRAVTAGKYQGIFSPGEWGEASSSGDHGIHAEGVKDAVRFENEIEEQLASIWAELLGVDKKAIGREDNFFELGGHSLKATTMMTR
ncbi:MAG TPA: amino acid adenylation domain-containing protein, partial [Candidatus Deferrimicrobium sp.]|nr:amino acid adenylation domain-containing protein [Candidatus Deferrimicrobium sp.]